MQKIKIIALPPGEAPEWVREAWVGLEMETSGLLPDEPITNLSLRGVLGGQDISNAGGYVVNPVHAFDVLKEANGKAHEWWVSNYVGNAMAPSRETLGGELVFSVSYIGELVFKKEVCAVVS